MKVVRSLCFGLGIALYATSAQAYNNKPVSVALQKLQGDWTWANFATLPNTDQKPQKDPDSKNRYMMTHLIQEDSPYISVTFYGTKERPDVAVVESRVWGGGDYPNFVRLDKIKGLVPLKSNCNLKNISYEISDKDDDGYEYTTGGNLDFQQVYRYSIGNKMLYMSSMQASSVVITGSFQTQQYTLSVITPHKDKLATFINAYAWSQNSHGKSIKCTVG